MRLLIADDEDYAREGLIASISWEKYGIDEIMQARDGREALAISMWFRPDIVLTDIRMPKLNGLEFAADPSVPRQQAFVYERLYGNRISEKSNFPGCGGICGKAN